MVVGSRVALGSKRGGLLAGLGPGIMYAGAAIGVSHLVQSTRAGAGYGFALVWAVVLVHLFKYPFFEFAHRYTAATGDNLLVGYKRVGRWALIAYLLVALALSIPTAAVLTIVTAGMASQLFPVDLSPFVWGVVLLSGCAILLASGGYSLLDKLMKLLMAVLASCTLVAVVAAFSHGRAAPAEFVAPRLWDVAGVSFLIALMGWMPTPLDAAAFPSVWMEEHSRRRRHRPHLREALFDFHVGYVGSLVTALMFLALGALVMFGGGESIADRADTFAAQFVSMYTGALGEWSRPLVVAAAFITMFSTTLAVIDAYPRVLCAGVRTAWPRSERLGRQPYWVVMVVMMVSALCIFRFWTSHMRPLVDFAATVAFLSAPLFAYLNVRVIRSGGLPREASPPKWLIWLSWSGLAFLTGFSILYLLMRWSPIGS